MTAVLRCAAFGAPSECRTSTSGPTADELAALIERAVATEAEADGRVR